MTTHELIKEESIPASIAGKALDVGGRQVRKIRRGLQELPADRPLTKEERTAFEELLAAREAVEKEREDRVKAREALRKEQEKKRIFHGHRWEFLGQERRNKPWRGKRSGGRGASSSRR